MNASELNTRKSTLLGILLLLFASMIWGSTFVAQSVGMDHVGPFTFNAVRSLIAAAALGCASLVLTWVKKARGTYVPPTRSDNRLLLIGGLSVGAVYAVAACLQQIGMQYTTVGKSGFLTALYIIEVPLVSLFFGKRVRLPVWISVGIALVGMYLLCMNGALVLETGDLLVLLCSVAFTGHILVIDYFAPRVDPIKLSALQFLVAGVISFLIMLIFEEPSIPAIGSAMGAILYAALLSSGIAYTLQILGQKHLQPTLASLLMSLESVFALLSGAIVLHELPTPKEGIGAALMFGAILLSQLPARKKSERTRG